MGDRRGLTRANPLFRPKPQLYDATADTPNNALTTDSSDSRNIPLTWDEATENWSAIDEDLGVGSVGATREEALEMLDEAVALHTGEAGEPIDSWEEKKERLEGLGIDPSQVKESCEAGTQSPEFMR